MVKFQNTLLQLNGKLQIADLKMDKGFEQTLFQRKHKVTKKYGYEKI